MLNNISNYIELHNVNNAIDSERTLFHQQALTTFLIELREFLGQTIHVMRAANLAIVIQHIPGENNIRYLQKGFGFPQLFNSKPVAQPKRPETTFHAALPQALNGHNNRSLKIRFNLPLGLNQILDLSTLLIYQICISASQIKAQPPSKTVSAKSMIQKSNTFSVTQNRHL